jgi:hypothetical protein
MTGEILHVAETTPASETLRTARVMKVRRPECDAYPDSLSDV